MVGLGEDLQKCGGDDLGRFKRALYEQVLSSVCQACQGLRSPRLAARRHDSTRVCGKVY